MMRKVGIWGAVLAAAFATPAFGQSFLGAWTATAHLEGDLESSETLTVVRADNGYSVTAKAVDAPPGAPEAGPGTDIMLDGDKFSYKRSLNIGGGNTIVIAYAGTVSGDTFTGTAELGGTMIPYTGVRTGDGK